MTTGKTIVLTRQTFFGKVKSLLFDMLYKLVIAFLPRSKHLLLSWLQSPSAVILEPKKIKSVPTPVFLGFPGGSDGKESACSVGDLDLTWAGKISWRRAWQLIPVFLSGESPWTEEPAGLQSIGLQRVGHD